MKRFRYLVCLCLVAAALSLPLVRRATLPEDTALYVYSVGQGDSLLLRTGDVDVLIDGGPDNTVLQELGNVRPAWDRTIEVVVLTHAHDDHLQGLLEVFRRYTVGLVVMPDIPHESQSFQKFLELLDEQNIPVKAATSGQRIRIDDVVLSVIAPDETLRDQGMRNLNNGSVVIHADIHGHTALLTGDIEASAERHLMRVTPPHLLSADIMQAPHHGSNTSSSEDFITMVGPAVAFASVGERNRYGHPSPEVVERYAFLGIRLLRTDTAGTIRFTFPRGAGSVTIQCELGC
jgi:competence protein ComEC